MLQKEINTMKIKWRAKYSDGTCLDQKDGKSQYPQINRDKLAAFDILDLDKSPDNPIFRMWLGKGQKLIYRHRVQLTMNAGKTSEVWMVGYQENINGKNKQVINYVFPDGHIEQAGKWYGGAPIFQDYEKL